MEARVGRDGQGGESISSSTLNASLLCTASHLAHDSLFMIGQAFTSPAAPPVASSSTPTTPAASTALAASAALAAQRCLRDHLSRARSVLRGVKLPRVDAFEACCVTSSAALGATNLALSCGLGAVRPETVALALPAAGSFAEEEGAREREEEGIVRELTALGKNVLLLCNFGASAVPASTTATRVTRGSGGGFLGSPPLPQPLHTPLHAPSLAIAHRTSRVDVWLFGELPPQSVWDEASALSGAELLPGTLAADVDAARDATLALQFGYLAHAALCRSIPSALARLLSGRDASCDSSPALRVLQLRAIAATGQGGNSEGHSINHSRPDAEESGRAHLQRAADGEHSSLRSLLREIRVRAEAVVLEWPHPTESSAPPSQPQMKISDMSWLRGRPEAIKQLNAALCAHSSDAAFVLLLLPDRADLGAGVVSRDDDTANAAAQQQQQPAGWARALRAMVEGLPPTALCRSGGAPVVTTEI